MCLMENLLKLDKFKYPITDALCILVAQFLSGLSSVDCSDLYDAKTILKGKKINCLVKISSLTQKFKVAAGPSGVY